MANAANGGGNDAMDNTLLQISNPSLVSLPTFRPAGFPDNSSTITSSGASITDTGLSSSSTTASSTSAEISSSGTGFSAPPTSSVAEAAASNTAPVLVQDNSKMNGLIAGIVVFAILFLAATSALIWTIIKQRKNLARNAIKEPRSPQNDKFSSTQSVSDLEGTIANLESQLHEKDELLRRRNVSMIASNRPLITRTHTIQRLSLSEGSLRARFSALHQGIQEWVEMHFGTARIIERPPQKAVARLSKSFPDYADALQEGYTISMIFQCMVADMLCESFASGQLIGNEAFWELKQAIFATASSASANLWRATTSQLLDKIPAYQSDRREAIEDLSKAIDTACTELSATDPDEARIVRLEKVVDLAAGLALEMAKQQALYKVEKRNATTFCPNTMEPFQSSMEAIEGMPIRAIVYPMVSKWGREDGSDWDSGQVVLKAKVLL